METETPAPSIDDVDLNLLEELQRLTPLERIIFHQRALELVEAVREAGRRHYGDPSPGTDPAPR